MKYVVMINFVNDGVIEPRTAKIFDDVQAAKQAAYDFIDQDLNRINERPDLPSTPAYQLSPRNLTPTKYQKGIYRVDLIEWINEQPLIAALMSERISEHPLIVETAVVCPVE